MPETGVGDPGAGKRTGDYVTTAGGPTSGGATPVPTGSNVQAGNASAIVMELAEARRKEIVWQMPRTDNILLEFVAEKLWKNAVN